MTQTLQLSGNENVWLMDDGTLQIYGIKICDTEAELGQGEIVGIQYPSEFARKLLDFLRDGLNKLEENDDDEMREWNPEDDDEELEDDPYAPGYDRDD